MIMHRLTRNEQTSPTRKASYHELAGAAPRRFFFYRANNEIPGAPIVVSVHGIARNAAAHTYRLIDEAERYGLSIIAPLFEKEHYGQYQQLVDAKTDIRADLALLDMLGAAARLSKADAGRVLLFGFSGGAQFSHRFVLAHPSRVASAVHVSAGWYTFPDEAKRYPYGLRGGRAQLRLDLAASLKAPQHVIVGERDLERDSALRQTSRLDARQGKTRVERAHRWVEAMSKVSAGGGAVPSLQFMPSVAHSFVDAVETGCLPRRVFDHFAKDANLAVIK